MTTRSGPALPGRRARDTGRASDAFGPNASSMSTRACDGRVAGLHLGFIGFQRERPASRRWKSQIRTIPPARAQGLAASFLHLNFSVDFPAKCTRPESGSFAGDEPSASGAPIGMFHVQDSPAADCYCQAPIRSSGLAWIKAREGSEAVSRGTGLERGFGAGRSGERRILPGERSPAVDARDGEGGPSARRSGSPSRWRSSAARRSCSSTCFLM